MALYSTRLLNIFYYIKKQFKFPREKDILPVWRYLKKFKNGTVLWPSNSTSRNLSVETQNTNSKESMYHYDHCSIIYNGQELEAAQVSISRWEDKKALVHLHNGILLGSKKQGSLTFCNSMDGPGENYAKYNKPVRERQITYAFIYMWNLMNKLS